LQALGHRVLLIPAQHVKAFCRVHKSDGHDALAIAEAAQRPNLHFVPVKTVEQQDLQLLGRIRERLIQQRTATINPSRGLAREYGVHFSLSRQAFMREVPSALDVADGRLSCVAREALADLRDDILRLDRRIDALQARIEALARQHPAYERLMTIPGIGLANGAALLAAIGDGHQFSNGRQCAALLGLVPRQHGTGGKVHLGAITKSGDSSLRTAVIHGARAVVRWAAKHDHAQSRWILALIARRGKNKATVALANKMVRIVWAVLAGEVTFDQRKAFRPQPAR
jgi:transposase